MATLDLTPASNAGHASRSNATHSHWQFADLQKGALGLVIRLDLVLSLFGLHGVLATAHRCHLLRLLHHLGLQQWAGRAGLVTGCDSQRRVPGHYIGVEASPQQQRAEHRAHVTAVPALCMHNSTVMGW